MTTSNNPMICDVTMTNTYFLEVGTEELPFPFLQSAPTEFQTRVETFLKEKGLSFNLVSVQATPRRLVLTICGLPDHQPDQPVETKGPPIKMAFDAAGKPTKAAEGFAQKVGCVVSELTQQTIGNETYLFYQKTLPGQATTALLQAELPNLLLGLSGSHFMRWGSIEEKFSRPIQWLLSLWSDGRNDTPLPITIADVTSGTVTYGHRVMGPGPFEIKRIADYESTLQEKGSVWVNIAARKERIFHQLQAAAQKAGGVLLENDTLLDEVTLLVESPNVVMGTFAERYLVIPKEVLTTVMAAHQRYFPVGDAKTGQLLPVFLTVSNGRPEAAENIRAGNERVLCARFEDAAFFVSEDAKMTLEERLPKLHKVTFQKGLGTIFEKASRLEALTQTVGDLLKLSPNDQTASNRAAKLCKADLVTALVFEFTELQGVIGQRYAERDGESNAVSTAIFEHYLPRFQGEKLAQTPAGIALSIADKVDTLTAVFSLKDARIPTGSKDPLGLRRLTVGLIQTILHHQLDLNLYTLFEAAQLQLKQYTTQAPATIIELLETFVVQRLKGLMEERGFDSDSIQAVFATVRPMENLGLVVARLEALQQLVNTQHESAVMIQEAANRIDRILEQSGKFDPLNLVGTLPEVDAKLFQHDSEKALFNVVDAWSFAVNDVAEVKQLVGLSTTVATFFEAVLVNDENEAIRQNRLTLLAWAHRCFMQLARFRVLTLLSEPAKIETATVS